MWDFKAIWSSFHDFWGKNDDFWGKNDDFWNKKIFLWDKKEVLLRKNWFWDRNIRFSRWEDWFWRIQRRLRLFVDILFDFRTVKFNLKDDFWWFINNFCVLIRLPTTLVQRGPKSIPPSKCSIQFAFPVKKSILLAQKTPFRTSSLSKNLVSKNFVFIVDDYRIDITNRLMTSVNFHRPCKLFLFLFRLDFSDRSLSKIHNYFCFYFRHKAISNKFY